MSISVQLSISGGALVYRAETIRILNEFFKNHIEFLDKEEDLLEIESNYVMTDFRVVSVYDKHFCSKCVETLDLITDQTNFRYRRIHEKRALLIDKLFAGLKL